MKYNINGIELQVQSAGNGSVSILFLHYYGGSSRTWTEVIDILQDAYHCISYDLRGWGQSDKPETGYSIESLANDAVALIQQLQLQRFILAGHSMGGKVAQLLASRQLPGLEKLILVAPSPPVPTILPAAEKAFLLHAYDNRENIQLALDNALTATPLPPHILERTIADSLQHSPASQAGWPEIAMPEDISKAVQHINVPVLVLSGEHDKVDPVTRLQKELLPFIPNAVMEVLPGTGHLSMLEAPRLVANSILAFIS
ncbi:pimeloyl-ACP methyl ester carboxylesterase [Chitinophaga niastensis]|uniref:Pimeloyl-ACP methyl ester carboxylesterase n=1 Tax=Chitinophaga niastensis TaxID=536980 RepID=A0A2P8HCD7_CHINA|nr:alpha/beta hydrolase [Chitinophaga niastensis]PSL43895.1 pimeloyl-ACP methyl ester carboxylesterase [Chitinophaga niastensis]